MVELNRVDEVQRFRTYKIYGKHHLPHYGEHKLVATIHMNTGDNSLADCENLPVLFMNAQTYRDDAMRLRSEIEQKDREISRLQAGVEQALRERDHAVEALLMQVEQIDRDATEYYGTAIGYSEKDPSGDILRTAFARHRKYGYDQGYYDGRQMDHIAKPDPLVDAVKDILDDDSLHNADEFSEALCAALAKRGLEIREREQWNTSLALSSAGSGHSSVTSLDLTKE